jgi:hypothetical protein
MRDSYAQVPGLAVTDEDQELGIVSSPRGRSRPVRQTASVLAPRHRQATTAGRCGACGARPDRMGFGSKRDDPAAYRSLTAALT